MNQSCITIHTSTLTIHTDYFLDNAKFCNGYCFTVLSYFKEDDFISVVSNILNQCLLAVVVSLLIKK